MTIAALIAIGSCVLVILLFVGRAAMRWAAGDLRDGSVSREWLIQHQSND